MSETTYISEERESRSCVNKPIFQEYVYPGTEPITVKSIPPSL